MLTHKSSGGTTFHYSSDLSGTLIIVSPEGEEFHTNHYDVFEFVAERVREARVNRIEDAHWKSVLYGEFT